MIEYSDEEAYKYYLKGSPKYLRQKYEMRVLEKSLLDAGFVPGTEEYNSLLPKSPSRFNERYREVKIARLDIHEEGGKAYVKWQNIFAGTALAITFVSFLLMCGLPDGDIGVLLLMIFAPSLPFWYWAMPPLMVRKYIHLCEKAERDMDVYRVVIRNRWKMERKAAVMDVELERIRKEERRWKVRKRPEQKITE